MVEDTMFSGESKNIEYKISLPDKSEKYMKTIVAFANTQGGKLIVGVDDKTHQIVGVENDVLFQLMDGIANAVSDSCVPQIIPDIEPQTVDGKTVIVVSVEAGKNRPYYLKSKGKDNGTYIRVAGTSRQAFPEKIKELEMEGARISWDELTCVGYPVSEEATEKLCQDIEKFRKKAGMSEHSVKKEQLINWKILKQSEGQLLATNAYALLTSEYFSFAKTQCAVFKGTDRAVFLDKREFTGPIYTQIEEAVDFVLRNIRLGATIDGLVRKEKYELPPEAIREILFLVCMRLSVAEMGLKSNTWLLGVIVPVQAQSDGGTKTIRVAYREDADFINKSSSGVYKGYGVEYLNKISQYTGWKYEYINEPWEDQLADLKSGKVDLICNAQKTEAREKDYDFSCMPVGTEQAVLYTSEDNEDIYFQDYEHMNGKKVGLLRDSYQNEEFEQRQDEKNFHCPEEYYESEQDQIEALEQLKAEVPDLT